MTSRYTLFCCLFPAVNPIFSGPRMLGTDWTYSEFHRRQYDCNFHTIRLFKIYTTFLVQIDVLLIHQIIVAGYTLG